MKLYKAYHILPVVFLSLTAATSVALSNYGKPGCNDKCWNVRSLLESEQTVLSMNAINHLEVLSVVGLENQTVTVNNMQKISNCSKMIKSLDLAKTPFMYSNSHNKFVVEVCGNALMMDDDGSVLTGCSTTCLNNTYESHGCGSAFLVDKDLYEPFAVRGTDSAIPTSLLWTLAGIDKNQVICCVARNDNLLVDMGNGTVVDTWSCSFREVFLENPYLANGCSGQWTFYWIDDDLPSEYFKKEVFKDKHQENRMKGVYGRIRDTERDFDLRKSTMEKHVLELQKE
ncbi:wall-associated receptor kinase [Artemisia annua]|uniref:Wall-associated receptor kinase n=1 Tax=Artemisia annua TaxID=35608 RepID=A0A2U1PJZ7_ARTAN|nr:wall-associated receptor kinase [Artemisia annua]